MTPTTLPRLTRAFGALESPAECASPSRLEQGVEPPPEHILEAVQSQRTELHRIWVATLLEGPRAQRSRALEARASASALGYEPLQAEAALVLGKVLLHDGDPDARAVLEEAANLGESTGDLALRERALRELTRYAWTSGPTRSSPVALSPVTSPCCSAWETLPNARPAH